MAPFPFMFREAFAVPIPHMSDDWPIVRQALATTPRGMPVYNVWQLRYEKSSDRGSVGESTVWRLLASPVNEDHISKLCPELRAIVAAELAAGNSIAECWSGWGFGVLLHKPFLRKHATSEHICFRPINDPHYWQAEYACDALQQLVACRFP